MNKFQYKIARFTNAFTGGIFLVIFTLFVGGSIGIVVMFLKAKQYGSVVTIFPWISAFLFLIIVGVPIKIAYHWAERVFRRKFDCAPSSYSEEEVMQKLKELAIRIGKRLEGVDKVVETYETKSVAEKKFLYEQARKKKRKIKKEFWSMWRLARAFEFPTFISRETHTQY